MASLVVAYVDGAGGWRGEGLSVAGCPWEFGECCRRGWQGLVGECRLGCLSSVVCRGGKMLGPREKE